MPLEFTHLDGHAVHRQRAREILATHPEVRKLIGQNPLSALWIVRLVAVQWLAAYLLSDVSWLWIVVAAYLFGAFVNHALYVLIHECTHNLVFRNKAHNNYLGILCDFALAFPSAMAFRKYHLLHHQHLGEYEMDPDIVCHAEGRLIRDSAWRKALWVALLGVSQALRPLKVKGVKALDAWIIANILIIARSTCSSAGASDRRRSPTWRCRRSSRSGCIRSAAAGSRSTTRPGRAGDVFLLWSVEQDLLQHGLPQRAPRLCRDALEQSAQAEKTRAGLLRQPGVVSIVDRGVAEVHLRSLDVDLQPGGAGGAKSGGARPRPTAPAAREREASDGKAPQMARAERRRLGA